MSIKALPADTRRLIGSTSLIASPACLVRELVDNAIDARASSVDVLISRNTVDKIEVRDNGTGIASVNFHVLGRPAHSSKQEPSSTADAVGPPSLGFRGEGLASANSLGYVTVTTRTSDDAIASTFRLVSNVGGIAPGSQKAAPAPVGTTIVVTCLFSAVPVRRKVAIQEASKTIAAVKTLLSSYALARPNLRLSLKILQPGAAAASAAAAAAGPAEAKTAAPFYYRPSTVGFGSCTSMKQAVSALFGADVARQCQEVVASSKELLAGQSTLSQTLSQSLSQTLSNTNDEVVHANGFVFEAWLPQPGANFARLKLGSFVSVDGRPISADRYGSAAKKLTTIFTTAYAKSLVALQQYGGYGSPPQPLPLSKLHGLFIRLNIQCPPGSYDANVEPSKTDVLFADEHLLCDAFERLCRKVYGETQSPAYGQPFQSGRSLPSTPQRSQMATPFSRAGSTLERATPQRSQSMLGRAPQPPVDSPMAYTPSPASRVQMPSGDVSGGSSNAPVRIQLASARHGDNRRHLIAASRPRPRPMLSRSLRTPPASPLEGFRGRITRAQNGSSSEHLGILGVAPCGGLRQTTISFHGPRASDGQATTGVREDQREPAGFGTGQATGSLPSFVSARELRNTRPQASAGSAGTRTQTPFQTPAQQRSVQPPGLLSRAENPETSDAESPQPSNASSLVSRQRTRIMKVDLQQLRRSAARFARNARAWEKEAEGDAEGNGGGEYLSPETADIASIEARLRAAITAWLAKARAERREGGSDAASSGPVQVELYLRKSLKQKALMVRARK